MKTKISMFAIILGVSFATFNCKEKAKEAETTEVEEIAVAEATAEKFVANPSETSITWTGYKPTGSHTGSINLTDGELFIDSDGDIESGNFTIDMASLKDSEGSEKLEGHLKSPDFFDVETYPNASFTVTGMEEVEGKTMLSGNLKLKDAENNVTFPVTVSSEGDTVTLRSETFTIDRSKWNVKYGSKSFFDNLGDKYINDDIELTVELKAKKA